MSVLASLALIAIATRRRQRTSLRGLGFIEVEYDVIMVGGGVFHTKGIQVGRFAVRPSEPGDNVGIQRIKANSWFVDHIPSKSVLVTVDTFEQAMSVADDASRFSHEDPDATDGRMLQQIGPSILSWLKDIMHNGYRMDYRQYAKKVLGFRTYEREDDL